MLGTIRDRLAAYEPNRLQHHGRLRAAVLIPLYTHLDRLHVVLTKRTEEVQHHKGEISFPGGAMDATDLDLETTALRECYEEIGVLPRDVSIIGRVDDIITVSDFHVTALVGAIDPSRSPYPWRPQASEVAQVLEVPLEHLLDSQNLVEVPRLRDGQVVLMEAFRYGEHLVWGATARMLRNFLDVVALPAGVGS